MVNLVEKEGGVLIFDDSAIAKQYSRSHVLPLLSYEYSGSYHKVIQKIGTVNLVVVGKDNTCIPLPHLFKKDWWEDKTHACTRNDNPRTESRYPSNYCCFWLQVWFSQNAQFLEKNKLIWVTVFRNKRLVDHNKHLLAKRFQTLVWWCIWKHMDLSEYSRHFSKQKEKLNILLQTNSTWHIWTSKLLLPKNGRLKIIIEA